MPVLWTSQMSVKDASRIVIDDFRVMLQIVASFTDNFRGIIYDPNIPATDQFESLLTISLILSIFFCHLNTHRCAI